MATATPSARQVQGFYYNGSDYDCLKSDGTFGLTFNVMTDPKRIVAQHIARRWLVSPGDLDVETIGVGIKRFLNMSLTTAQRDQLEADLRNAALDVDGVDRISLSVSSKRGPGLGIELTVSATVTPTRKFGGETFTTVFALTADTIKLIVDGQIT